MNRLSSSGFTLIEILFSISILGIMCLALFSMNTTIIKAYKDSKQQFEATLTAQCLYERIKASPFPDVGETITEFDDYKIISDIVEVEKYNGRLYKITVEVIKEDEVLEKIEGYKIFKYKEMQFEDSA